MARGAAPQTLTDRPGQLHRRVHAHPAGRKSRVPSHGVSFNHRTPGGASDTSLGLVNMDGEVLVKHDAGCA